jgi:hypothetical protein
MNEYVNSFYVMAVNEKPGELSGVSQLFGIPCGFTGDRWPEVTGTRYNHILTVQTKELCLPINDNISTLSIFYQSYTTDGTGRSPVEVVLSTEFDLESGRMDDYPPGHTPWWDDQHPMELSYNKGHAIQLCEQKIPKDIIKGMLLDDKDVIPDDDTINKFADDQSYIGGFPVWFQDEETPLSANGKRTHFVLALNGYNRYFKYSPFESQVSYLFFDDSGNPYWTIQD